MQRHWAYSHNAVLVCVLISRAAAQSTGATFGDVIRLGGTPSDVVLDESRGCLYLVKQTANRVDIYSYLQKQTIGSITTGSSPVAAAMSMDRQYLYVSNNGGASLTIIGLQNRIAINTVSLSANPEGVAVGADGRVLITTNGTSTTDQVNSLLLYDPAASQGAEVTPVSFAPPPSTPTALGTTVATRPLTTFRGKLARTPDGAFIIGMSTVNNNAQTILFVYEVASASILRSRTVTGQSTVLSMAPDGARFMAGFTMYDMATLAVIGQQSASNIPFPLSSGTTSFNTLQNIGGSAFSSDGETLYSAFNVAASTTPAPRPQASTLLIGSGRNLGVRLGIKLPESIVAKMVMTADGTEAWGLSESGLIHLPFANLYSYPILMPETTTVFLGQDPCNPGVVAGLLRILNAGDGKLTFSVPSTPSALVAQADTGVAPASITFQTEPGRMSVTRYPGTNLYSGAASNTGTPVSVNLASPEAINIPNTIRVYMNYRQTDQRGVVYPVNTISTTEGLQDILVDEARDRVYITNSGYNRIEVFDRTKQVFLRPIDAGQLPHQMALSGDGKTLYVANTGGESISLVDLDQGTLSGAVQYPAIPRSGTAAPTSPQAIAVGLSGLQAIQSDGSQWRVVNNVLTLRPSNSVTPTKLNTTTGTGPPRLVADDSQHYAIALAANGNTYLYDAMADTYTGTNRPYTSSTTINGYYGPLAAGPNANYFLVNGLVLNSSLAAVGGSESPSSSITYPLSSKRNVAAVAPAGEWTFVRLTTPVKQTISSTVNGDARPVLELADISRGSVTVVGPLAENPVNSLYGTTTRVNVPPRQLAVDSQGTVYAITLSGLTVSPLATGAAPSISTAAGAVVDATSGARTLTPGGFVAISGTNLATENTAVQLPPPTVLGGSCVLFSSVAMPLLQTSPGKIVAQIPATLAGGQYVVQVRSLATGQQSGQVIVTLQSR
jgi:DNA-binding beta-propeller fold protein YncE